MLWTVVACLAVFFPVILMMDLNGNVVIVSNGPFPDLLNPAPTLLIFLSLGIGTIVAITHGVRYEAKRYFRLAMSLIFVILFVAVILPAL